LPSEKSLQEISPSFHARFIINRRPNRCSAGGPRGPAAAVDAFSETPLRRRDPEPLGDGLDGNKEGAMRRVILALMLFVFVACQPATMELTEEQRSAIADSIRQIRGDLFAAAERLDAAELTSYFAEDGVFIIAGHYQSHDEFAQGIRNGFAGRQSLSWTIQDQRIDVLSANVVAVADIAVYVATDTLGITSEAPVMHTEVWVRRDGGWKILHAHESIDQESM
jgi:uncharacterized protein (TIGR02246 family)